MGWPDRLVGMVIRFVATWALVVCATALIVVSAVAASLVSEACVMMDEQVGEPNALREAREIVERAEALKRPS